MLIAFLIMLREGIEAALIVGIVAGFLKQGGYRHMMPKVWLGACLPVGLFIKKPAKFRRSSKSLWWA